MAKKTEKTWGDLFSIPLESLSKVKLPGGVVGKVAMVLIAMSFGGAGIAWSSPNPYVAITALICTSVVVYLLGSRLIKFAEDHPQAALMEGAEFLVHEKIQQLVGDNLTGLMERNEDEPKIIRSADRQLPEAGGTES
jgi:hypothetical protein